MSYRVLSDYRAGMPKTPKDGKPWRLIACHWTAGAAGWSGAVGTIGYMIQTAGTRNASYHELWAYDEATDAFSAIRIVPPTHCAHSLNPNQPPNGPYDPDAWVREALGASWWDPNQGVYAVSIAGGATECARYAGNLKFVAHAARRITEIRAEIRGLVGMAEHSRFQNNKADWGPALVPKLGGVRFTDALPDTSIEDDMPDIIERVLGQTGVIPRVGIPLRTAPTTKGNVAGQGDCYYVTRNPDERVQPYAIVKGTPYDVTGGTSDRYVAYIAKRLLYGYVPETYVELSAIGADPAIENRIAAAKTAAKGAQQAINATVTALEGI